MRCERHSWDTADAEWCWKCEELTIEENKKKYENKFCDNGLQRGNGDTEIDILLTRLQKTSG